MKKIISAFMAIVLVFCASVIAFATTEDTVFAGTNAISNGALVYYTEETETTGALNYGGTFGFCEEKGKAYIIKDDVCSVCKSEECHEEVTIFYAVKCRKCGTLNCAYNVNEFVCSYSDSLTKVTPDGSKVNECKVCGHLFDEKDLYNTRTETEIIPAEEEGEEPTTLTHTFYTNKYFRVYDCSEETMEKLVKVDSDVSLADYQSKATGSKVLGIFALPFLKLFGAMTFMPGYLLDILFYFVGDLVAGLL